MKTFSLGGVQLAVIALAGLIAAPAFAADIPTAAPVYKAPAPLAYSWTGLYAGGNIGIGLARNPTEFAVTTSNRFNLSPLGLIGGGQIGMNWQAAPNWVLGIEADFQGSGQTDSTSCFSGCTTNQLTAKQKLDWFGTVRGRLGWTNGPALFYGTGGFAYGRVTTDVDNTGPFTSTTPAHVTHLQSGWTAGGGVEAVLAGNWTGKIEYLYLDLGKLSGVAPGPDTVLFSSRVHDHIFRLGVNYKFGDPIHAHAATTNAAYKAPSATVAANWTGLYVGGNVGFGLARNETANSIVLPGGALSRNEKFNLNPNGAVGGGQIGFNWQTAPNWLIGVEADLQSSGQRDSTTCINGCVPNFIATFAQKIDWLTTVRARVGWINGPVLFYATGGWAYGEVSTDFTWVNTSPPPNDTAAGSFSTKKSGWTAGAGVEAQLIGNWTGKIEYLYVDLGTVSGTVLITGPGVFAGGPAGFSSQVHNHLFRVGLNYRFGGGETVIAKY